MTAVRGVDDLEGLAVRRIDELTAHDHPGGRRAGLMPTSPSCQATAQK